MKLVLFLFCLFSVGAGIYFWITDNSYTALALGLGLGGLFWFACMVLAVADLMPVMRARQRKLKRKA